MNIVDAFIQDMRDGFLLQPHILIPFLIGVYIIGAHIMARIAILWIQDNIDQMQLDPEPSYDEPLSWGGFERVMVAVAILVWPVILVVYLAYQILRLIGWLIRGILWLYGKILFPRGIVSRTMRQHRRELAQRALERHEQNQKDLDALTSAAWNLGLDDAPKSAGT